MSNQKTIKQLNRNLILSHIRNHGPISRWGISQELGLSASAVSNSVANLIERSLVYEKGEGTSSGGRKPILLDINPRGGLVIAVDIQSVSRQRRVYTAAVDLKGRIFKQTSQDITYADNESFLEAIAETIQEMLNHPDVELQQAISIGIATPGLVNNQTGELVMHGRRIRHLQLATELEQRFAYPVVVHNNVDAGAYGEYYFGSVQGCKNMLYLQIGYGVGAGFILDGEIYHATPISAGELGHMTILPDGPMCRCGNRGCLSVLVSSPIIVERVIEALDNGYIPSHNIHLNQNTDASIQSIIEAAEHGDEFCRSLMEQVAGWIGIAIANYVNLLGPEVIVLSSELFENSTLVFDLVNQTVQQRALDVLLENTTIRVSSMSRVVGLRGIAVLALNNLLTT